MANTTTKRAIVANDVKQGAAVHFEKQQAIKSHGGYVGDIDEASIPAELVKAEGRTFYNATS
jgi:hypothetical protein